MGTTRRGLISTADLAARLDEPAVGIVDGSWYLPGAVRDAAQEYRERHIPGAVFFDIDQVADTNSPLPHMLPSEVRFAAAAGALGISDTDEIVVYDGAGLFSAARVRWMFRTMGAQHVSILDGGLPAWLAEGRPVTADATTDAAATFRARLDAGAVRSLDQVRGHLTSGDAQIADARGAGRFRGKAPEPRPGVRRGHMPGAANVPMDTLVDGGRLKSDADLKAVFDQAGVDLARPIVTSCGSGVTAAVVNLALEQLGVEDAALYDGSWSEWGGRDDTEVVT